MSKVSIDIPYSRLMEISSKDSKFNEFKNFVKLIKLYLAYKISKTYKVDLNTSKELVRVRLSREDAISVGIESPTTYKSRYRDLVSKILTNDTGSFTKKVIPNNSIKSYCASLSNSIELLWLGFMRGR